MRIDVFGALRAFGADESAVPLGGPKQRALLAMLLVARGQVVSVDGLIDGVWRGVAPPRAVGVLQAYVSRLRRALEPDRLPRVPAVVLRSEPPGYAVGVPAVEVDAWRFEALVAGASSCADPAAVRAALEEALALWRGPVYAEVADESWAAGEVARLDGLRVVAQERLCAAILETGQPAEAAIAAELLVRRHPLREEPWRLLTLALYASGRQGDALAALRRARAQLAQDLGLDLGPALARLERDILTQHVDVAFLSLPAGSPRPVLAPAWAPAGPIVGLDSFVARAELDPLLAAAVEARETAHPVVVFVDGDAGAGKTTLLERCGEQLAARGWTVVRGRCPQERDAPPASVWVDILTALAARVDPGMEAAPLAALTSRMRTPPERDPAYGRYVLQGALSDYLTKAASRQPLALVLDDLHRADALTLNLLNAVTTQVTGAPLLLLLVSQSRTHDLDRPDALTPLAERAAKRVHVGGFDVEQATRLMSLVNGTAPDAGTARALVQRTGGNPMFLVESARLLRSEGVDAALSRVPDGVRQVLRQRLRRLGVPTVEVLRFAAVVGRRVDVEVLLRAAADLADEQAILDALEAGVLAGVLEEPAPGVVRFAHDVTRDALYADVSGVRRARWHARVAAALEALHPQDVAALAYHLYQSGTAAGARAAVAASTAAAEQAMSRYGAERAVELYGQALQALDRLHPNEAPALERVDLLSRLSRAQLAAGAGVAALDTRLAAARVAERSGDSALLAQALTAWDLPTPWAVHPYRTVNRELVRLHERALQVSGGSDDQRCRLLCALVQEVAGHEQKQAAEAATEAEQLARRSGDPSLIGLALWSRGTVLLHDSDLTRRLPIAEELGEIGRRPGLAVFALIGHTYVAQWAATYGHCAVLEEYTEELDTLVRTYGWRQTEGVVATSRGLLAHLRADLDEAQLQYQRGVEILRRNGALDVDRIAALAAFSVAVTRGSLAELEPMVRSFVPLPDEGVDLFAVVVTASGHPQEAEAARAGATPVRHDFFRSLLLTTRAIAVLALANPPNTGLAEAAETYRHLTEFTGQIGGAVTGAFALGPVDLVLGDLAQLLGQSDTAAAHYTAAAALATHCGSRIWADAARARSASLA